MGAHTGIDDTLGQPAGVGVHHARHDVAWNDVSHSFAHIRPRGVERALVRFRKRLPNLIFNDASLEGNTFTEPDVQTLLDGGSVAGYREDEEQQILDLSDAASEVQSRVLHGPITIARDLSDRINYLLARHEAIEAGRFRGEGNASGGGTVNVMGETFHAVSSADGGAELRRIFTEGVERIEAIEHPLVRATTYSAFAAYHQFHFDGNKRTARFVMNAVLISHGFDAIVTPAARRREYNTALRAMYTTHDLTPYVDFLISIYDAR